LKAPNATANGHILDIVEQQFIRLARPVGVTGGLPEIVAGRILELADDELSLAVHRKHRVLPITSFYGDNQIDQNIKRI
jgi:hypothetical protein